VFVVAVVAFGEGVVGAEVETLGFDCAGELVSVVFVRGLFGF